MMIKSSCSRAAFTKAEELSLHGDFQSDSLHSLSHLTNVRRLTISSPNVAEMTASHTWRALKKLQYLDIRYSAATGKCLGHLAGLEDLRTLIPPYRSVADDDLGYLSGLTTLEAITLVDSPITDAGRAEKRRMTSLKRAEPRWHGNNGRWSTRVGGLTEFLDSMA